MVDEKKAAAAAPTAPATTPIDPKLEAKAKKIAEKKVAIQKRIGELKEKEVFVAKKRAALEAQLKEMA